MHHGQVDRARPAHRPTDDAPVGRLHTESAGHRAHVLGAVIGRVAAGAVDALGVVVERATYVAGARPVPRGVELTGDHHDHGQLRGVRGEPRRRQVHQLGAVFEAGRVVGDVDRHQRPGRRSALAAHRHDTPALSRHSGIARIEKPRRHQALGRHPSTATAMAGPVNPIHTISEFGAGSPAMPCESIHQCAQPATVTPTTTATGSQISRHRRQRSCELAEARIRSRRPTPPTSRGGWRTP